MNELSDIGKLKYRDKTYLLAKSVKDVTALGYETSIPIEISSDKGIKNKDITFNFSDDGEELKGHRIDVTLSLRIKGIVNDDNISVQLNDIEITNLLSNRYRSEYIRRPPSPHIIEPYSGQILEFKLNENLPSIGSNKLSVSLLKRPDRLNCVVRVDDVSIKVIYS